MAGVYGRQKAMYVMYAHSMPQFESWDRKAECLAVIF